jgi:succinate dehydrogenase / fumarate reductase, cytochrome b subunit
MPSPIRRVLSSTVGSKLLIGLTGLGLFVYLITHLGGNAIIFAGPDAFNAYAHMLMSNPFIVVIEIGLLLLFLIHIYKAVTNYVQNRAARPDGYAMKVNAGHTSRKGFASTSMIATGIITAIFVIIHVKQFRFGTYYLVTDSDVRDLFRTEIEVFSNPFCEQVLYALEKWDRSPRSGTPLRVEAGEPGQPPASTRSSSWARGWRAPRRRRRSASSATTCSASASRTAPAARTASPRRAASTPPRTTRTTATASSGCSTTRSRAATTGRARPTSTGWRS